jgi:hypothetical protein
LKSVSAAYEANPSENNRHKVRLRTAVLPRQTLTPKHSNEIFDFLIHFGRRGYRLRYFLAQQLPKPFAQSMHGDINCIHADSTPGGGFGPRRPKGLTGRFAFGDYVRDGFGFNFFD